MATDFDLGEVEFKDGWDKLKDKKSITKLDKWVYDNTLFEDDDFIVIYDDSLIKSYTKKYVVFKKKYLICFKDLGSVFLPFDAPDYNSKKDKYFPAVSMMIDNKENVRRLMFWYDGEFSFSLGTGLDSDEVPDYIKDKIVKEAI